MRTSNLIASSKRVGEKAFTLVEVLAASAIAAIVLAALFYGIEQGYSLTQTERASLRATQIILGRMEGIRLCRWGTTNANEATQLFDTNYVPRTFVDYFYPVSLGGFAGTSITYNGTITIYTNNTSGANNFAFYTYTNGAFALNTPPTYSNSLALVVISVSWQERHRNASFATTNTYTRTMKSYIAEYGVQNYTIKN